MYEELIAEEKHKSGRFHRKLARKIFRKQSVSLITDIVYKAPQRLAEVSVLLFGIFLSNRPEITLALYF